MGITNTQEFEDWLRDKPITFAQVMAARAALRALPLLGSDELNLDVTTAVFQAAFVTWAKYNYPAQDITYIAYATDASRLDSVTANADSDARPRATLAALAIIDAAFATDFSIANEAVLATFRAADATFTERIWQNIEADASWLEAHETLEPNLVARGLAITPLWSNFIPPEIYHLWQDLRQELLYLNKDWDIWTDWYDLRLHGSTIAFSLLPTPYDDVTASIAMENNAFWKRDPEIVNAEIKARLLAGRPPVETAVSDSTKSTKPKARAKSPSKPEVKPKTKIGKAVLTNHGQITLQSTAITVLIAERIAVLQAQRPNSEEAIADRNNEIAELEKWQVIVTDVKTQTDRFAAGETKEAELETIVDVLKAAIIEYIKKNGTEAGGMTVKAAIISLAMTLSCFCGIPGIIGITAIGSVIGGKTFVDALKSAKGIGKSAIRK